jgi:hypothetical protein
MAANIAGRLFGMALTLVMPFVLQAHFIACSSTCGDCRVASLYDVLGGFRAMMFDRFTGVKDKVRRIRSCNNWRRSCFRRASEEGTHFLIPRVQRAILHDCRTKPRVHLLVLLHHER